MKTVGIVGGIGPESTLDYYARLNTTFKRRDPFGNYPQIIINSINLKRALDHIHEGRFEMLAAEMALAVGKLADAGADFAVLSSNTAHIVYDQVRDQSPLPMISILDVTCRRANLLGLKKLGLFGTRFTMQGNFYQAAAARHKIELVLPDRDAQDFIHEKYLNELVNGILLDETRTALKKIASKMKTADNIDGIILGGTELPLIIREPMVAGIPVLDTSGIHVEAIVNRLSGN